MRSAVVMVVVLWIGAPAPVGAQEDPEVSLEDIADLFLDKGQPDKAIEIYDELLLAKPGDADLTVKLAEACQASEKCAPRRVAVLRAAVAAASKRLDLLHDLADIQAAAGDHRSAAATLRAYLAQRPTDAAARLALIDELLALGDKPGALREVKVHLKSAPKDADLRWREIELLEDVGRPADLDRALAAYVKDHPQSGDAWLLIAERALTNDDVPAAERARAKIRPATLTDPESRPRLAALDRDLAAERADRNKDRALRFRDFRHDIRWTDLTEDLDPGDDY